MSDAMPAGDRVHNARRPCNFVTIMNLMTPAPSQSRA